MEAAIIIVPLTINSNVQAITYIGTIHVAIKETLFNIVLMDAQATHASQIITI
jgi:hypothetical protein